MTNLVMCVCVCVITYQIPDPARLVIRPRIHNYNSKIHKWTYADVERHYSLPALSVIGVEGVGGNGILIFSVKRWSPQGIGNFCTVCSTMVHIWRRFSGLGGSY